MPVRTAEVSERIARPSARTTGSDLGPRSQHTVVTVAASVIVLGIAEGGYSDEARAVFAILVWTTVLVGVGLRRLPRSRPPDAALAAGAALALLAVLTGLSAAWASDDAAVVDELVRVGSYLGLFALVVCTSRDDDVRAWLTGLALGIGAIAALAVVSRLLPFLPGGDEGIAEALPSASGRLSFPIGYWNGLAALVAAGAVLIAWFAAFARTRGGRAAATAALPVLALTIYLTSSRGGFIALAVGLLVLLALGPRRAAIAGSALLGLLGGLLVAEIARRQEALINGETGGEASWEGLQLLVGTVMVMALVGGTRVAIDRTLARWKRPRISGRVGIALGALLLAATLVAVDPAQRLEEFRQLPTTGTEASAAGSLDRLSGSGRWQFWTEAVDAFESAPLHGIGAGAYETYWNQHAPIAQMVTQAHSLYLELLAELGPGGLLLLLGFLAVGPIRCVRDRSLFADSDAVAPAVALVCAGAISAGFDWTWELPAVFGPVIVASGLLTGAAFAPVALMQLRAKRARRNGSRRNGSRRRARGIRLPRPAAAALTAIGLVLALLAADSLLAERTIDASQAAARENDLDRAADEARGAIALRPWDPEARLQLALVQESAGQFDAAEQSIIEAIERSPEDWILWVIRGRIASLDARPRDAILAYARGVELNPKGAEATGLIDALTPDQAPAGPPEARGSPPPSRPPVGGGAS